MTALYAILGIIVIAGIMTGAYLVGFGDGVTAEKMRRSIYIVNKKIELSNDKSHEEDLNE